MAPPAIGNPISSASSVGEDCNKHVMLSTANTLPGPLNYFGTLDSYRHFDTTSVIGREFPDLQLSDILHDDFKIRDLAVLGWSIRPFKSKTRFKHITAQLTVQKVSQRCVVFFRNQDLNIGDQKLLGQKLGELTGKPASSKLHRDALANGKRGIPVDQNGRCDDEVSVISSEIGKKFFQDRVTLASKKIASVGWHAE